MATVSATRRVEVEACIAALVVKIKAKREHFVQARARVEGADRKLATTAHKLDELEREFDVWKCRGGEDVPFDFAHRKRVLKGMGKDNQKFKVLIRTSLRDMEKSAKDIQILDQRVRDQRHSLRPSPHAKTWEVATLVLPFLQFHEVVHQARGVNSAWREATDNFIRAKFLHTVGEDPSDPCREDVASDSVETKAFKTVMRHWRKEWSVTRGRGKKKTTTFSVGRHELLFWYAGRLDIQCVKALGEYSSENRGILKFWPGYVSTAWYARYSIPRQFGDDIVSCEARDTFHERPRFWRLLKLAHAGSMERIKSRMVYRLATTHNIHVLDNLDRLVCFYMGPDAGVAAYKVRRTLRHMEEEKKKKTRKRVLMDIKKGRDRPFQLVCKRQRLL